MIEIQIDEDKKFKLERNRDDFLINGEKSAITIEQFNDEKFKVFTDKKIYSVELLERNANILSLSVDGRILSLSISTHIDQMLKKLGINGLSAKTIKEIKAPMPGTILSLNVSKGDEVSTGDTLIILEAMKMENAIKSPVDGKISEVLVKLGDNVEKNQSLISFD